MWMRAASILTDGRHKAAAPLYSQTYARIRDKISPLIEAKRVPVLGRLHRRHREWRDHHARPRRLRFHRAAIFGAGIGAEEIQIWTDVDGVMTCDPKLVPDAHRVKTISFAEAAELAYFGAQGFAPCDAAAGQWKKIFPSWC